METPPPLNSKNSTDGVTLSQERDPSTIRTSRLSISDDTSYRNSTKNSNSNAFPGIDIAGDFGYHIQSGVAGGDGEHRAPSLSVNNLLQKVPQSVWQPNAVVQRHRQKANLYWLLLLIGYAIYIVLVSG